MNLPTPSTWAFGGVLRDLPAHAAWAVLAGGWLVGALLTWLSYRTAVRPLAKPQRFVLGMLRLAFLAVVLLCLANPTRIERTVIPPPPPPAPVAQRLALVVDRSDSMTRADNRGRTRLDDALATWRRIEPAAAAAFAPFKYYSIAADLRPARSLEEARTRTGDTGETHLFQPLAVLLAAPADQRPNAVVVLTDGLDTTGTPGTLLRDRALAAGVPVYFVVGSNRDRSSPFLRIREWRAPATVLSHTTFTLETAFEAFSLEDRTVAFSLWEGGRRVDGGRIALTPGLNLVPWTFHVESDEPRILDFQLRLGEGPDAPVVARSATLVEGARPIRVLVYQGAFDWGLRYFTGALRTDPNFQVFSLVNAALQVNLGPPVADFGGQMSGRLSESADFYSQFDTVVLSHLYPHQLNIRQQQALADFARDGGGVLFTSPDPPAVSEYQGTPLADLLPVEFDPDDSGPAPDPDAGNSRRRVDHALLPFRLTDAGWSSPIFAAANPGDRLIPLFHDYVRVARAKPGADILAIHPTSRDGITGSPEILLATQAFGKGHAAFLGTDGLWRWKLTEPSASTAVATFWQQLVLALGRRPEPEHLSFVGAPATARLGEAVPLRLAGADSAHRPAIEAKAPDGRIRRLAVEPAEDGEAAWSADWTPDQAGPWQFAASIAGDPLRAYAFTAVAAEARGELAPTPPAIEPLRALAEATGGALLLREPPAAWRAPAAEKAAQPVVREDRLLLWNRTSVLALALALFATELILRRIWKLV